MIGLNGQRVYLDWNASAPLRPKAGAAMLEAMDAVGNPSSAHTEGRAARAIVEKARGQVAALVGCAPDEVVFTSGATEAAAMLMYGDGEDVGSELEHDCIWGHIEREPWNVEWSQKHLQVSADGRVSLTHEGSLDLERHPQLVLCQQAANGETGTIQDVGFDDVEPRRVICDAVQVAGKVDFRTIAFNANWRLLSGHKLGAPKGIGALIAHDWNDLEALFSGGGQEQGRRSGTENVAGIAGFGAAAEAAKRDLESGLWDRVELLRDNLEDRLVSEAPELIIFGRGAHRLPNTSCFAVPGWAGETQVMQMDLAGFAVSAGSACSSGKVQKASRVLLAMGFDEETASSAIRVSMGAVTTEAEVMAFADAWIDAYRRRKSRAA